MSRGWPGPAALACAAWLAAACGSTEPAPLAEEALLRLQCDQLMIGLDHHVATAGVRRARVVADTACFLEGRAQVHLKRVRATFFDAQGQTGSTLTADSAVYDWMTGDMEAFGHVVVVDPATRRQVETSVMRYGRNRDEIWSDRPTTLREPDGTVVEGAGFRSTSSLQRIEMESARLTKPPAAGPDEGRTESDSVPPRPAPRDGATGPPPDSAAMRPTPASGSGGAPVGGADPRGRPSRRPG